MSGAVQNTVTADFDSNGDMVFSKVDGGTPLLTFTEDKIECKIPVVPGAVAPSQVLPGTPIIYEIDIADAVSGDTDVVLTCKTRVTGVQVVKTGGAGGSGNTITVKNGANAITDAIDMNIADKVTKSAGTIDDARHDIAAAGTLRVSSAKSSGNAACIVYVHGIVVA